MAQAAAVLQLEVEARGVAEFQDGGGRHGEDHGVPARGEGAHGPADDGVRLQLGAVPEVPVPELDEGHAVVLAAAGHAEPAHGQAGGDRFLLIVLEEVLDLGQDLLGLFQGGSGGQLHEGEDDALVLLGQEGGGQPQEQDPHADDDHAVDDGVAAPLGEHPLQLAHEDVVELVVGPVEPQEEGARDRPPLLGGFVALLDGLEEGDAEGGREDQGHHHGQHHGRDEGEGELPEDDARGSAEEGHGAEHGGQHQADAHQGAGDLAHGLPGGRQGRQALLVHDALDVLHHDDGIVHQEADGQHHGEHGEHVDGHAHILEDREGAQEHHRDRDGRDQGGAEVPEEEQHDQEDEDHGLDEGLHHLVDGHGYEGGRLVGVVDLDPRGEIGGELVELGLDELGGVQRVGARGQADEHAGGRLPVELRVAFVGLGSELGAGHIPEADRGAIRVDAEGDGPELLGRLEEFLHIHGHIQPLALDGGEAARLAGGDLRVVGLHGLADVVGRDAVPHHAIRVEPDPHGVLGAEGEDLADALHAADDILHIRGQVVAQVLGIHAAVRRGDGQDHEDVLRGLGDRDAHLLHDLGHQGLGQLQLVLDLGPGGVGIGARLEGERDAAVAGGVAAGGHVEQPVQARHLLLDDLGDGVLHGLGGGPGIEGVHGDGGRGDGRVLGDGQGVDGQEASQHHDDGHHPGENGPVDEEIDHGSGSLTSTLR